MHRRSYLVGLGSGSLLLAGCAGAPTDFDDETPDQSATSYAVRQLGDSFTEPRWASTGQPTESAGVAARFENRDELRWLADSRETTPETATEFVDATDFGSAVILYLQSVGPNGCYREIAVDEVAVDDAITATASVVDTSQEGTICTQAITYPSAFVRVTGDNLPVSTRVTLTNGSGVTAEVDANAPLSDPETFSSDV